jgi:hypothetical protein
MYTVNDLATIVTDMATSNFHLLHQVVVSHVSTASFPFTVFSEAAGKRKAPCWSVYLARPLTQSVKDCPALYGDYQNCLWYEEKDYADGKCRCELDSVAHRPFREDG